VTLFWSTRNATEAAIYQLDRSGNRGRVWNVDPASTLTIPTRESDRGQLDFVLSVGEGALTIEQTLTIGLACPVQWFFSPPPLECAESEPEEVFMIEQQFERGRMVYVERGDLIYVLFNDGREPAWVTFQNVYDPAIHDELDEAFERSLEPGFFQPIARLGFVWRGNDTVRSRLGLGINAETAYQGLIQSATVAGDAEILYLSSTGGTVLQLLDDGEGWQIITLR